MVRGDLFRLPEYGDMLGRREKITHDLVGVCAMDALLSDHALRLAEDWLAYERAVREVAQQPQIIKDALRIIWAGGGWDAVSDQLGRLDPDEWSALVRAWVQASFEWLPVSAEVPQETASEDE